MSAAFMFQDIFLGGTKCRLKNMVLVAKKLHPALGGIVVPGHQDLLEPSCQLTTLCVVLT
jgi:hypothetical protein